MASVQELLDEIIVLRTEVEVWKKSAAYLQTRLQSETERRVEAAMNLKSHKYMRYCNVTRNEISKFDKYAWATGFRYIYADLDYIIEQGGTYEDVQEEKRKLRLCHVFRNSNEEDVTRIKSKIPHGMDSDTFAAKLARGYRLISEDIHTLSYSAACVSQCISEYCPALTRDKGVKECLEIVVDEIEFNVGVMVPRVRKQKTNDDARP